LNLENNISIRILVIEDPYSGSNLSQLEGYQGWNIDSSFQDIIKKKEKQKKRKK